jgi:hypothetical protein
MKVTANQLAALLKMAVGDAKKMMAVVHFRMRGEMATSFKDGTEDLAPASIDTADLLKYRGIDIEPMVRNVKQNYLRSPGTRQFILSTYPLGQIEKAGARHCSLRIPAFLAVLLTDDQKQEIWDYWNMHYGKLMNVTVSQGKEDVDA